MAEDKNKPDLLRGPIELALERFHAEVENFQGNIAQPIAPLQEMHDRGIRLKDIRQGLRE